jgi:hypothetical protein
MRRLLWLALAFKARTGMFTIARALTQCATRKQKKRRKEGTRRALDSYATRRQTRAGFTLRPKRRHRGKAIASEAILP